MLRSERQRSPAAPSANHFRGDQFFLFGACRLLTQIFPKLGDSRVKFAKGEEGAVAAQHLGLRACRCLSQFVWITHDELARLDGRTEARMDRGTASFHLMIVKALLEPERIASIRKLTELQSVDNGDLREIVMTLSCSLQNHFQALVIL